MRDRPPLFVDQATLDRQWAALLRHECTERERAERLARYVEARIRAQAWQEILERDVRIEKLEMVIREMLRLKGEHGE